MVDSWGGGQVYQLSVLFNLSKQSKEQPAPFHTGLRPRYTAFYLLQLTPLRRWRRIKVVEGGGRGPSQLHRAGLKEQTWYVSVFSHHDHLSPYIISLQVISVPHWLSFSTFLCFPLALFKTGKIKSCTNWNASPPPLRLHWFTFCGGTRSPVGYLHPQTWQIEKISQATLISVSQLSVKTKAERLTAQCFLMPRFNHSPLPAGVSLPDLWIWKLKLSSRTKAHLQTLSRLQSWRCRIW